MHSAMAHGVVEERVREFADFLDTRTARRGQAFLPVTIMTAAGDKSVGLLRDVSTAGMFVYSNLTPDVGSELRVIVHPSATDCGVTVCCKCKVVRVEAGMAGSATGIGVTIEGYDANHERQLRKTPTKKRAS